MPSRCHLVGFEATLPARPYDSVLAEAKQPCRLPCTDELRSSDQIWSRRRRVGLDILEAESLVSTGRGFGRVKALARHCAQNSRLAYAQALGRLPRTDQSVQDVCRTNAAL